MFLEYISFRKNDTNENIPYIKLEMVANVKNDRIYSDTYIGDIEGDRLKGYKIAGYEIIE